VNIICHRGYWLSPEEKNTSASFKRAFDLGLGIETDLRDLNGEIVISHDPPKGGEITLSDFLESTPRNLPLALNIKSDGIAVKVREELVRVGHKNFFFFDMSIPDMQEYINMNLPIAARISEYEGFVESLFIKANNIWLDMFCSLWYSRDDIIKLINSGKHIYIVSAELHGKSIDEQWKLLETFKSSENLTLCTDHPLEAIRRFL
jgi:hypothetical protein